MGYYIIFVILVKLYNTGSKITVNYNNDKFIEI